MCVLLPCKLLKEACLKVPLRKAKKVSVRDMNGLCRAEPTCVIAVLQWLAV